MLLRLTDLVAQLGGELRGADVEIQRIAPLETAQAGELAFLSDPKLRPLLSQTHASAVIVTAEAWLDCAVAAIVTLFRTRTWKRCIGKSTNSPWRRISIGAYGHWCKPGSAILISTTWDMPSSGSRSTTRTRMPFSPCDQ